MARKIISFGTGDRLEITPPEENTGVNFEKGSYVAIWRSYPQQPSRADQCLWWATYPNIREAEFEIMTNLYAHVPRNAVDKHRAEIGAAIAELSKHDKAPGAKDVDRSRCPRKMSREDYAYDMFSPDAPVYKVIEEHLPGCKPCRDEDQLWRSESRKEKRSLWARIRRR